MTQVHQKPEPRNLLEKELKARSRVFEKFSEGKKLAKSKNGVEPNASYNLFLLKLSAEVPKKVHSNWYFANNKATDISIAEGQ